MSEVVAETWMVKRHQCFFYMVSHILYSILLCRNISSKVEPSFVENINMMAGFGGRRCDYV